MEMSQGNTLYSYLKLIKMSLFFPTKSENRRAEQVLLGWMGESGWYQWEGEYVGNGYKRVKMVQILCTHVCKWKNETC
jgi:hypothetical protein